MTMTKFAECPRCHNVYPVLDMRLTASRKRGMNAIYCCEHCARHNERYHTSNDVVIGVPKKHEIACGIEFESSFSDEFARTMFFEYGFIPTHDGSLDSDERGNRYGWDGSTCEYVSGIMQGLNVASKLCLSADYMMQNGHLKVNDSCGTHFHVSVNNMKERKADGTERQVYMGYIRRFYHSLFIPLTEEMKAHPVETERVFGRTFTGYAKEITWDSQQRQDVHNDRYYWINCLADSNIEFRLNKFVNGKQYQKLMHMEVEMVQCIVKNFCEHFNDTPKDARRYPNKTSYRKHKAQVTANKLVKIFREYAEI